MARKVPRLLDRFNYWRFSEIVWPPVEARGLADRERDAWSQAMRRRPAAKLDGETELDVVRGLEYRMLSDPQWASDSEAQAAVSRLSRGERAQLGRRVRRTGVHDVPWLLQRVARDQQIWERRMFDRVEPDVIAKKFSLDERGVGEVLRHYNRQSYRLRGLSVAFSVKALQELRVATAMGRVKLEGARLRLGSATCHDLEEVRHWFAHALRNLAQWYQGHRRSLWEPQCRDRCLAHRDRLASPPASEPTP